MLPPFTRAAAETKANKEESNVMKAILEMRSIFSSKIDAILTSIQDIKTKIQHFAGRLSEAENRISNTEDSVSDIQKTVQALGTQVETLNTRLDNLENQHRRNNLCLINLPEKAIKGRSFGRVVM